MEVTPESRPYAGRNALNAKELRDSIRSRSIARGDPLEVREWLCNHFWRHTVANFNNVLSITTLEEARRVLQNDKLPGWLELRLAESGSGRVPIVWISVDDPALLDLENRLVEFLSSRKWTALEGKLSRINCPQALGLWEKEHAEMQSRIDRGWRQSNEGALRTVLDFSDGRIVEFDPSSPLLRGELAYKSYIMRHCLGQFADRRNLKGGYGEHYAQAVEQGQMRIMSLRDKNGQPHVTISLEVFGKAPPRIEQVKGKQNRPPIERYVDAILLGLNKIETDLETPVDCLNIGIARTDKGWQRIDAISDSTWQAKLVARNPNMLSWLSNPSLLTEWIVAARQPKILKNRPPKSAAIRYALRDNQKNPSKTQFFTDGIPWPDFCQCEMNCHETGS